MTILWKRPRDFIPFYNNIFKVSAIDSYMTILWRRPRNPDFVALSSLIVTDSETNTKQICVTSSCSGPCGIPEEKWLPVRAYGSLEKDIYNFNGEEIKGRDNVVSKMREYIQRNYSRLLS